MFKGCLINKKTSLLNNWRRKKNNWRIWEIYRQKMKIDMFNN